MACSHSLFAAPMPASILYPALHPGSFLPQPTAPAGWVICSVSVLLAGFAKGRHWQESRGKREVYTLSLLPVTQALLQTPPVHGSSALSTTEYNHFLLLLSIQIWGINSAPLLLISGWRGLGWPLVLPLNLPTTVRGALSHPCRTLLSAGTWTSWVRKHTLRGSVGF